MSVNITAICITREGIDNDVRYNSKQRGYVDLQKTTQFKQHVVFVPFVHIEHVSYS